MDDYTPNFSTAKPSLIGEPVETRRAWLVWQSPLNSRGSRERHAVGELWQEDGETLFRYCQNDRLAKAKEEGFTDYPGLPLGRSSDRQRGIDVLFHRILPRARPDYEEYLNQFGISDTHGLSPLSILAYTGARLTRDSFSVCETFDGFGNEVSYVFEVAGYRRRWQQVRDLSEGHPVSFVADSENPHDESAVKIVTNDNRRIHLGYINRLQSSVVRRWVDTCTVSATVYRNFSNPYFPEMHVRADIVAEKALVAA